MSKTYEEILQGLKDAFEKNAAAWGDLTGYLKTTQSKNITLQDWNTLIALLGRTDAYIRAMYPLISGLGDLGTAYANTPIVRGAVNDDGTLTLTRGDGVEVSVEGSVVGPPGAVGPEGPEGPDAIAPIMLPQKWYSLNEKLEDGHKIMGGLIYKDMNGNVQAFPLAPAYGVRKDEAGESIPTVVVYNSAQQIMCKPATDGRHAVSLQQLDKLFGGTDSDSEKTFSVKRIPPVDTSVPIAQRRQYVFCRDSENNFAGKYYTAAPHVRSLAERDDYGNIQIQPPVVDSHAVTLGFLKTYVSDELAKIPNAKGVGF